MAKKAAPPPCSINPLLYEQCFHPVRGEDPYLWHQLCGVYVNHFGQRNVYSQELIGQLATVTIDIRRVENVMTRIGHELYVNDPLAWLKHNGTYLQQRNSLLAAKERLIQRVVIETTIKPSKYDENGEPYKIRSHWTLMKFSRESDTKLNTAHEFIEMSDGSFRSGYVLPLRDFMNGDFESPESGLAAEFHKFIREYPYELHHPTDPEKMKKRIR